MENLTDRIDTGIQALAEGSDSSVPAERDWKSEYERLVDGIGTMQSSYERRAEYLLQNLMATEQEQAAKPDMWRAGCSFGRRESLELVIKLVGELRYLRADGRQP